MAAIGFILFITILITFVVGTISILIALINYFQYKNDEKNNQIYKSPLKIGLTSFLILGIFCLLITMLCSGGF